MNNANLNTETSLRDHLQKVLVERCKQNPSYSMRSMAKSLGLEPGFLSKLLNGKRKVTPQLLTRLSPLLALSPSQVKSFEQGILLERYGNSEMAQGASADPSINFQEISQDAFEAKSEWYHDAILELVRLPGFQATPAALSRALGITFHEAKEAIKRLQRLDLLDLDENGNWIANEFVNTTFLTQNHTSAAQLKYQRGVFERALNALEIPKNRRDHSSVMMAINEKDLVEVQKRITKFRRELCAFLQREDSPPESIYQLAVAIFPITETNPFKQRTRRKP